MSGQPRGIQRLKMTLVKSAPRIGASLIDRYLGSTDSTSAVEYSSLGSASSPNVALRLVDTTAQPNLGNKNEQPMLWHVLWIRDEASAAVEIESGDRNDIWPIAPGDSCFVPAGATLRTSGDQLALAISLTGDSLPDTQYGPPTHGVDQMYGHNRKTTAFLFGNIAVSRWKLTEPLHPTEHANSNIIVFALAGALVVRTSTTIDPLSRGQAVSVIPESDIVITPDGLGYLLVIEAKAEASAIEELRAAGATDAEIA